jgi:DNA-binding NtrC family response regulator
MSSFFRDDRGELRPADLHSTRSVPVALSKQTPGLLVVIDDDPAWLSALERVLRPDGHRIACMTSAAGLEPWLADASLDGVVIDLGLQGSASAGIDVLLRVKQERPDVAVIVMTGRANIESAVACMRRGAFDYLSKPFEDVQRVRSTVRKAIEQRQRVAAALSPSTHGAGDDRLPLSLDAYEKRVLERALHELRGDATAAAKQLGIGRSTFYRKLAKHGIHARTPGVVLASGVGGPESIG